MPQLTEQEKAQLSQVVGKNVAAGVKSGNLSPAQAQERVATQGDMEAKGKLTSDAATKLAARGTQSFAKGGKVGPKGGVVEEGETVLPKDNPKKSAELAMKHLGLEAGMTDGAKEKKAAKKKPAKKAAKKEDKSKMPHARPAHTHIEHLKDGGHIIKHQYPKGKEGEPMPEDSTHLAMDDQGMQDHMSQMPPAEQDQAAASAPPEAAAPPMPQA